MIPDTMAGGVLLSLVNMSVVFLVLGFLAVLIGFIARTVNGKGDNGEIDSKEQNEGPGQDSNDSDADTPDISCDLERDLSETDRAQERSQALDPKVKAAITAAISLFLSDGVRGPVFVRKISGRGAWGKSYQDYRHGGLLSSRKGF